MRLAGNSVWVVGASRGIGYAVAKAAHVRGARLLLSARTKEPLNDLASHLRAEPAAAVYAFDVTDADLSGHARHADERMNGVDCLIYCAGISQRSLVCETKMEVYRRLMDVNYFGAVGLAVSVLPGMLRRGAGHFVVVSSLVGKFGTPRRSGYAASKHALHGFFDCLRAENRRHGVRVTLVCPGFVKTDITKFALTGDGSPYARIDRELEQGMDADLCARAIVSAIERNREEIYLGGWEKYAIWINRFAPRLLNRFVK